MHMAARQIGGAIFASATPRLDAEPNQIGRADPTQNFEQRGGISDHPAQAQRNGGE